MLKTYGYKAPNAIMPFDSGNGFYYYQTDGKKKHQFIYQSGKIEEVAKDCISSIAFYKECVKDGTWKLIEGEPFSDLKEYTTRWTEIHLP